MTTKYDKGAWQYSAYEDDAQRAFGTKCFKPLRHDIQFGDTSKLEEALRNASYEYVHGAYGLGHAVEYTFPRIAIIFRKGEYKAIGEMDFRSPWWMALCWGKCPDEWDFTMVIEEAERKLSSKTVGVSKYEPRVGPRIVFEKK